MKPELHLDFPATWTAKILPGAPMIAPATQYTWPRFVPGEEDAMARGAMFLDVKPASGPNFLATCALGFADPSMPSGLWSCPDAHHLLAVSGGYAYLADVRQPRLREHLPLKPVTAVKSFPEQGLLVLAGFHHALALDANGTRWTSGRLTWEGLTLGDIVNGQLTGTGWDMMADKDVPFAINLASGQHTGGGYQRS